MFTGYSNCPSCGILHDDGGIVTYKEHDFFLCMDCIDNFPGEDIMKKIDEYIKKKITQEVK